MGKERKRRILFIYSCQQDGMYLQQNIALIYQLVKEFSQKNEIFILSSTDTLKLVFSDNINIYVNKITEQSVMNLIKDKQIDLVVPTIGDCDKLMYNIMPKLKIIRVENFYDSFFKNIKNKSFFKKIALQVGFGTKSFHSSKQDKKKTLAMLDIFAIKDYFGNQIILDIFETNEHENNRDIKNNHNNITKNFHSQTILNKISSKDPLFKRNVTQLINNFGKLLNINGCFYCIKINIRNDLKIVFHGIDYLLSEDAIFSTQRKQVNLGKILYNIYQKINIIVDYGNDEWISCASDYKNNFIINYYNSTADQGVILQNETEETNYHDSITNLEQSKKKKIDKNNNDTPSSLKTEKYKISNSVTIVNNNTQITTPTILHYNHNNIFAITKIKYFQFADIKTSYEYILVSIEDDLYDDINNYIIFYKICNIISNKAKKKIIFLTKKITPLLSIIDSNIYIAVYDNIDCVDIKKIKTIFNIKYAYITPSAKSKKIIKKLYDNNISLIYQNGYENEFLCGNRNKLKEICNNNNILFKFNIDNNKEKIMHYTSIVDKNKNIISPILTTEYFNGSINANCFFYPSILINYYVEEQIKQAYNKLLNCLKSYGLIDVTFIYQDGDIYVYNISFFRDKKIFYLLGDKKDTLFQFLSQSIAKNNINSTCLEKENNNDYGNFYKPQSICFEQIEKQTVTLTDITKERAINKYNKIFIKK